MNPRSKALLVLLLVFCLGGLVFAGPMHQALHAPDHSGDCDACSVVGTSAPSEVRIVPFVSLLRPLVEALPVEVHAVPLFCQGRPRAPPRAV